MWWTAMWPLALRTWHSAVGWQLLSASPAPVGSQAFRSLPYHMRGTWRLPATWRVSQAYLPPLSLGRRVEIPGPLSTLVGRFTAMHRPRSSQHGWQSWRGVMAWPQKGRPWWALPHVSALALQNGLCLLALVSSGRNRENCTCDDEQGSHLCTAKLYCLNPGHWNDQNVIAHQLDKTQWTR